MQSQVLQIPSGLFNVVNDPSPGLPVVPEGTGVSPYVSQVGKWCSYDDAALKFDSSIGTLYGGEFQYVRLSAGSTSPAVGQTVFWDLTTDASLYVVTTLESGTTDGAVYIAGVVLSAAVTAGNYTLIQTVGLVAVKFRAVLTSAGVVGSAVYTAAAGAGADNGLADVLSSGNPTTFADVAKMQRRFLGVAKTAPVGGATSLIELGFERIRQ